MMQRRARFDYLTLEAQEFAAKFNQLALTSEHVGDYFLCLKYQSAFKRVLRNI
jgi:hypothetical protein